MRGFYIYGLPEGRPVSVGEGDMDTKQQVGVGISLALTTAVCWGALPIAMKEVLVVMEPFTVVWYRFTMAAIGLGVILAVRGKLPRLTMFRQPRWLLLLAIATAGLLGNFVFFSSRCNT